MYLYSICQVTTIHAVMQPSHKISAILTQELCTLPNTLLIASQARFQLYISTSALESLLSIIFMVSTLQLRSEMSITD